MRDLPVGNGSLLVNFDDRYRIRDIYFPHVGQENHTEGYPCRFGIWVDGSFSWIESADWTKELKYLPETLVTDVVLTNRSLGVKIESNDTVTSHTNIFIRRCIVTDISGRQRKIRIYLHHDLRIYENKFGDTAFLHPETGAIVHYKKHRYFLINSEPRFQTFATGRKDFNGQEGTWRDAEDGHLESGAITEGSVDSTIGIHLDLEPNGNASFYYWIAAGFDLKQVVELDHHIKERTPDNYLNYTSNYWKAWVNKDNADLSKLPEKVVELYKRSLLIIQTQIDEGGAILAANDYDVTERATDHYSYLWTRDGAFVANALDLAHYTYLTRKFFDLCGRIVHPDGYFLQKYNADGTVASGWHASIVPHTGEHRLPIQEDETGLVLWALWQHYDKFRDIEFAHRLYKKMIVRCADFMSGYRDELTRLPKPSWNLWEDRYGCHTFTCSAVAAGLRGAANFAKLFAEFELADKYDKAANEVIEAMKKHLYSKELGRFVRSIFSSDSETNIDDTVDASLFGTFYLGCFEADDEMVVGTMNAIEEKLFVDGGIARFENDGYMKKSSDNTGNPWFICTLWLGEYKIAAAKNINDLDQALDILQMVADAALASGTLAEQFDPVTQEHLSVSPLTWSHSTYVAAVLNYYKKLETFTLGS